MIRTFIYGSCVSRDTFEFLDKGEFSLLRYVARSSLVSAFSPPGPVPLTEGHGLSPFQLRQVETDAESGLLPLLREHADRIDLLLWDLVDERLGFYESSDGHVVTDSVELRKAGAHAALDGYRQYAFGSRQHLKRFRAALTPWREFLEERNLLHRLVVVAPPWAEIDADGSPAPASFGLTGAGANQTVAQYLDALQGASFQQVIGRELNVRTDKNHRWGAAPFHYTPDIYDALTSAVEDICASQAPRRN
ncbi:DUF6270 domain-containing protein [Intrasporangium calvum]|uniref:DUF6270 domain-containing protein n=1 Tax=Intrasporangium calvum TaxID=53358 RepID=A0ABT5GJT6_9MICO|nr:DUF6270 domain-containing protein [Intrasporangium calvum]MDC5698349.1 DUF6270 domain-containing protein [Intrasporangium calvum]